MKRITGLMQKYFYAVALQLRDTHHKAARLHDGFRKGSTRPTAHLFLNRPRPLHRAAP
ncbi:MAG: hypothetical protein WAM74_23090 [Xanthobacteraceae bacterium]|jgi:hypothetical protein